MIKLILQEVRVGRRRNPTPVKWFEREFGFKPVDGASPIVVMQRDLERRIVALHLGELWRSLERAELELMHREPPSWLKKTRAYVAPNRQKLEEAVNLLRERYRDADNLAKAFNLHPEQPVKDE